MRHAIVLLLLAALDAEAIVIRDDVPDREYRMADLDFPALADLPGEGHGVLIAPHWVVTAAHAVDWQSAVTTVTLVGTPRAVRRIIVHPGYQAPPEAMVHAAIKSGDWNAFFAFLVASDDLALIELAEPANDIAPAPLFRGPALGREVRILGRGATGNGIAGRPLHGPSRIELRQGFNVISLAEGRWIGYRFDPPPYAHPLEATTGSGDSGGPLLVKDDGEWQLAGIAAWGRAEVVGTEVRPGRYGETSYGVRLAHYADWIDSTMAAAGAD